MSFSTVGVVATLDTAEKLDQIGECSLFLEQIRGTGFSVETIKILNHESVREALEEALRVKDVVIAWGRFNKPRGYVYQMVADIFCVPLEPNAMLTKLLNANNLEYESTNVALPRNSRLLPCGDAAYPIIQLHRLFILDPDFFSGEHHTALIASLIRRLEVYRSPQKFRKTYTITPMDGIKDYLNNLIKFKNGLNIDFVPGKTEFSLSTSSADMEELNLIQIDLKKNLDEFITRIEFSDYQEEALMSSDDEHIVCAINCIRECFTMYTPKNVFISFNGGKDCTVLLHMMLIVLRRDYPDYREPVDCMYVKSDNPFSPVDEFITTVKECYNLNIITIESGIRQALQKILGEKPHLQACLMGTRRMDPFSEHLEHFKMTDNGWPSVMRVSPLLDWDYGSIWDYLIDFKVPYCCLYDNGYTSLGNTNNTVKNPELLYERLASHQKYYLPAYKLFDGSNERLGRL